MGNRSSVSASHLTPPLAIDADAHLSSPTMPDLHTDDVAARMAAKRHSLSFVNLSPRPLTLPPPRPGTALSLNLSSTSASPPSPSLSPSSRPPPLPSTAFTSVVDRQLALHNNPRRASHSSSRRKSLTRHSNRVAPEELLSTPAQRHAHHYHLRSLHSSPAGSPQLSPHPSPKHSARASPVGSPGASPEVSVRRGINPLHIEQVGLRESPAPSPKRPGAAGAPSGRVRGGGGGWGGGGVRDVSGCVLDGGAVRAE